MILQQAVSSGRPFRRSGVIPDCGYYVTMRGTSDDPESDAALVGMEGWEYCVSVADIMAADWEIQETTKTVSRSQLNDAWYAAFRVDGQHSTYCTAVARSLGLEEQIK